MFFAGAVELRTAMGMKDLVGDSVHLSTLILWLIPLEHLLFAVYWVYYNNRNWSIDPRLKVVSMIQTGLAFLIIAEWIVLFLVQILYPDRYMNLIVRVFLIFTEMAVESIAQRYMARNAGD